LALATVSAIFAPVAQATSYYVDCVNGSTSGTGSISLLWKGLHQASAFNGGDTLYLKRGCAWNWHLSPTVTPSGTSAFSIDAYGNGAPPTIQGEISSFSWNAVSGHPNVYVAVVAASSEGTSTAAYFFNPYRVDAVKINGIWAKCIGMNDTLNADNFCGPAVTGGLSALTTAAINGSWYYDGNYTTAAGAGYASCATLANLNSGTSSILTNDCGNLYVYSTTGAPSNVAAVSDGAGQLVKIAGTSYVSIQHLKLLNYSWYGIEVSGAADNVALANIYADTEVPFNYHGIGFYIHPTASSNIQLLATEAHRGYYGYQFCQSTQPGCVTAATVTNCKAYFNRAAPLSDQSGTNAVTYDYCHFYGNGIGSPTDLAPSGGTPGTHNIAPLTDPHVVSWLNYAPRMVLNFQKPGAEFGDDTALDAQPPAIGSEPLSIGIATNYTYSTALISQFQTWINDGYDIDSLGLSATSYANDQALNIQYTGTGTAAALTINGPPATSFAITVSGTPADSFTFPITSTTTVAQLKAALLATGKYCGGVASAMWSLFMDRRRGDAGARPSGRKRGIDSYCYGGRAIFGRHQSGAVLERRSGEVEGLDDGQSNFPVRPSMDL
jgi:hypothetical protein